MRKEYRDFIAVDEAVNSRNNNAARTISVVTNLSATEAQALADKTLAANKNPALAFEITFEGTMEADSLVGNNPTATVTLPKFKVFSRYMRIVSVRTDYEANITTVQVRG